MSAGDPLISRSKVSVRARRARLNARRFQIAQCAGAAGVAWLLAHELLGHKSPVFAAVAAIGFAIGAALRYRTARSTPSQIAIGHHSIRLDETDLPYAQLSRIWLTPPAYPVHRIRLDRAGGRGMTVIVGSTRVTMTPSYEEFLQALRSETAHLPGLISLDLE